MIPINLTVWALPIGSIDIKGLLSIFQQLAENTKLNTTLFMEHCEACSWEPYIHDKHCQLAAKMVSFAAGNATTLPRLCKSIWQYEIIAEFLMSPIWGEFSFRKRCSKPIEYLSTNDLCQKKDGSVTYTVWCNANGGCGRWLIKFSAKRTRMVCDHNAFQFGERSRSYQKRSKELSLCSHPRPF